MKNRFDLIIFDWDGTLANSIDWIVQCIQQAAVDYGRAIPDIQATKGIIGLSIEQALQTLFPDCTSETHQAIAKSYGSTFFSKPVTPDDLFPGVHDMLRYLRGEGYQLAIATGKKHLGLTKAIEGTGVSELFSTTRSADQTASKPNPLMIDEIVTELGVSKQRTLMVGDSIHDLQMALNAQVASIAVTCGAHPASVLQEYQPLRCLVSCSALTEIL